MIGSKSLHSLPFILLATLICGIAQAESLKLNCLFADHMVLQRDKPVPVWGWSEAGKSVEVAFAGQSKSVQAGPDGKWSLKLDPIAANAAGREMVVRSGDEKIVIDDILVGEVWLGSGQSNMAMTVNRAADYEKEQAASQLPLIRHFKEGSDSAKTAQQNGSGSWQVCSPETVGGFSATLFFFGRAIHKELHVPIGLINSSVGGTPIESWIDAETQRSTPELKEFFATQAAENASFDEAAVKAAYEKQLARWEEQRNAAKKDKKPLPARPRDPIQTRSRKVDIGGLFNGKIAPLVPFAIRGIVWYQGEANAHPGKSIHYHHQLSLLIRDWRKRWNEELPIAWVQLPNFNREGEYWPEVREGMLKTLTLPKTGMAIAIDIGEEKDIHPKNKQDVGKRLALWALGEVYGEKVGSTSGPLPVDHRVVGSAVRVRFSHAEGGLKAREGDVDGFVVSGADGKWKPATVRVEGDSIVASNPEVTAPVALRYNWAPFPNGDLVNGFNLPATPFRTDAPR